MTSNPLITIRLGRRELIAALGLILIVAAFLAYPVLTVGQDAQKSYKEKFNVANESGGVGVASSSDGKYVYVVGPQGILVSDDFGKTGSWVQTVRLK